MGLAAKARRVFFSRQFYLNGLLYAVLAGAAAAAFAAYFGSVGRAAAMLRGDLVYCRDKAIDLGDRKHLEGVETVVRLENITDEPVRIEGMNEFGQSMTIGARYPIEIPPGHAADIPFVIVVRSTNKNPVFQQQLVFHVGSKRYGRQEASLVVNGTVIDAHQVPLTGCCGG